MVSRSFNFEILMEWDQKAVPVPISSAFFHLAGSRCWDGGDGGGIGGRVARGTSAKGNSMGLPGLVGEGLQGLGR